jgi:acyl-CoA synthetase (NDP forming)
VARALDRCPLPAGERVGIVTNAGGPAIMATDACVNLGLEIATLSDATRETLRSFLPPSASTANPVDMIASASAEQYGRTLAAVLADDGVDGAIVINVTPLLADPDDVLTAVAGAAAASAKPVLAVMMAEEGFYERLKERTDRPPVYRFPESAARAFQQLVRYADWKRRPVEDSVAALAALDGKIDRTAIERLLAAPGDDGYLDPAATFRLLDELGVPTAGFRVAGDRDAAVAAAHEIGFPVVVKAISPGLVHKSEAKAIELDLADESAVEEAVDELAARFARAGLPLAGFLVQEMASEGHETIFGLSADPRYGPVLMFGLGGKYVEVFRDVRFGVTPLARDEAGDLVRGIRGAKLLSGVRGDEPVDFAVLEETLLRLAWLAERFPEIVELDINPFLAAPAGRGKAVDARVRVAR